MKIIIFRLESEKKIKLKLKNISKQIKNLFQNHFS